mmetsp:Transcript_10762/g.40282  ORF Transcript_10762/g.40282 Transcript_10762/m.40282 type:complete len:87 (+) Transcript_10762:68-328(+)
MTTEKIQQLLSDIGVNVEMISLRRCIHSVDESKRYLHLGKLFCGDNESMLHVIHGLCDKENALGAVVMEYSDFCRAHYFLGLPSNW